MNKIRQLLVGGVRIRVVFINQQKAGEGAGSPLPPDWLVSWLTCFCVCMCECVWANFKRLNCVKWLYFSLYPSVSGVTFIVVGQLSRSARPDRETDITEQLEDKQQVLSTARHL